jgi:ribose transport system substrate-binding protein
MKMRKFILLLVIIFLVFSLFVALVSAEASDIRIFFQTQLGHPYATALADIVKEEAKYYGYKVDVFDMKGDIPTQVSQIESGIASKYNVMIIQPYDPIALIPAVKKAYNAGIPIVMAGMELGKDGMQYVSTYIGSSGIAEGISAGEMIVEALGGVGNIVAIEGASGHPLVPQRGGEAYRVIKETSDIKILGKETGKWNGAVAMTVMENFITAYGDKIDLVYCHDSGMAFGAMEAIKEAGLVDKIKVVSINGSQAEFDAIKAGTMYGTILNSASFIAVNAVQRARDLIERRPILKRYISPADKITLDNVNSYKADF